MSDIDAAIAAMLDAGDIDALLAAIEADAGRLDALIAETDAALIAKGDHATRRLVAALEAALEAALAKLDATNEH